MSDKITGRISFSPLSISVSLTVFFGIFAAIAFYLLAGMVWSGQGHFLVFLALAGYIGLWLILVRHLWCEQPKVTIDRRGVWYRAFFTHSGFVWEDVAKIAVLETGVHHFEQAEVSTFTLKDGEKFVIWIDAYRNGVTLRQVIDQAEKLLSDGRPIGAALQFEPKFSDISEEVFDKDKAKVYAGNHVFTFRGICFLVMNLVGIYYLIKMNTTGVSIFLMFHVISWLWGYDLYYFQTTERHLIVRHHLFFLYKKIIPLSEIRQCVFYQKFRRARGLRVILNDFRSFNFPAGSLSEMHWRDLQKVLKKSNISLRGRF